jgi:hypothetical protein
MCTWRWTWSSTAYVRGVIASFSSIWDSGSVSLARSTRSVIYTGVDWSGDPGDPARRPGISPLFVFACVSIAGEDLPFLSARLAHVRALRRLPNDHCFKHLTSKPGVRFAFFQAVALLPIRIHSTVIDKQWWGEDYLRGSDGLLRICDAIVKLISCCPDDIVARQSLLIDLDRSAAKEVRTIRANLRIALAGQKRLPFAKVRACPNHRDLGEIVQIADMVAGELRERGEWGGPYLEMITKQATMCE